MKQNQPSSSGWLPIAIFQSIQSTHVSVCVALSMHTPAMQECFDVTLAAFLNGFINDKRGKKDGAQPKPEIELNNNLIFRKLRIALNLKDEEIIAMLKSVGLIIGKAELSAFFRRFDHKNRRHCKDQVLRNFLHGMQIKYRPANTAGQSH